MIISRTSPSVRPGDQDGAVSRRAHAKYNQLPASTVASQPSTRAPASTLNSMASGALGQPPLLRLHRETFCNSKATGGCSILGGVVVVAPLDLDLKRAVALGEDDGGAGPVHVGKLHRASLQ